MGFDLGTQIIMKRKKGPRIISCAVKVRFHQNVPMKDIGAGSEDIMSATCRLRGEIGGMNDRRLLQDANIVNA